MCMRRAAQEVGLNSEVLDVKKTRPTVSIQFRTTKRVDERTSLVYIPAKTHKRMGRDQQA